MVRDMLLTQERWIHRHMVLPPLGLWIKMQRRACAMLNSAVTSYCL